MDVLPPIYANSFGDNSLEWKQTFLFCMTEATVDEKCRCLQSYNNEQYFPDPETFQLKHMQFLIYAMKNHDSQVYDKLDMAYALYRIGDWEEMFQIFSEIDAYIEASVVND